MQYNENMKKSQIILEKVRKRVQICFVCSFILEKPLSHCGMVSSQTIHIILLLVLSVVALLKEEVASKCPLSKNIFFKVAKNGTHILGFR